MANVIKLRKGLDINLKGKPAKELLSVKEPGFYSLVPDDFTGITPKVVVKEQEYVMAGGPLFIDKNHPELKFVSPVSEYRHVCLFPPTSLRCDCRPHRAA